MQFIQPTKNFTQIEYKSQVPALELCFLPQQVELQVQALSQLLQK